MRTAPSTVLSPACPERADLVAFNVGNLPGERWEFVATHLEGCASCQASLETLAGNPDPLLDQLRQPGLYLACLDEPECRILEARAKEITLGAPHAGREPAPAEGPAAAPGLVLPIAFGQYQLLERLGQGGMGTVYKALHTRLKKQVAIKTLRADRAADPHALTRFYREMEAVGRLDHPNIIRALDANEIDGCHFLVMEFAEGLDLARLVDRCGPLAVADACELVRQAALGLQCAHDHGLIHRDIKPSNLLLTPQGVVKVLDLGLARFRAVDAAAEQLTDSGQIVGTADYMAPEQGTLQGHVDIRADLYSLGCTLYKLLAGRPPFSGPGYDWDVKKLLAHAYDPVPPIQDRRSDVPAEVAAVLDRLLAKSPDDRFAVPAVVAKVLVSWTEGCDLPGLLAAARRATPELPAPEGNALPGSVRILPRAGPSLAQKAARAWHGGSWKSRAVVAAALLLVISLGAWVVPAPWRNQPRPEDTDRSSQGSGRGSAPEENGPGPDVPLKMLPALTPALERRWEPLTLYRLLDRPPHKLFWWNPAGLSHCQPFPEREQLWVDCESVALFGLGRVDDPGYQIQLGIRQNQWVGGAGLVLGYREEQADGKMLRSFQTIELRRGLSGGQRGLRLARTRHQLRGGREQPPASESANLALEAIPSPGLQEHILEATVSRRGLIRVKWNGTELPRLSDDMLDPRPDVSDYRGAFGIFALSSATTFGNARFLVFERRP